MCYYSSYAFYNRSLVIFQSFCLSFCQFSNRAGWFRSPTDRWNCNTDVLHSRSCDSSWNCLCDSHMAGDSTSYHTSQLSFPVILLVTAITFLFLPHPQNYLLMHSWVLFNTNSSCFFCKRIFPNLVFSRSWTLSVSSEKHIQKVWVLWLQHLLMALDGGKLIWVIS